jgi:hypothetical protein
MERVGDPRRAGGPMIPTGLSPPCPTKNLGWALLSFVASVERYEPARTALGRRAGLIVPTEGYAFSDSPIVATFEDWRARA